MHISGLLTFGGIDSEGKWRYPKDKKKLCKNKVFRNKFRERFLENLEKQISKGTISIQAHQQETIEEMREKSWSFHSTSPTMETGSIELYLARYINRIAITNSRVEYIKQTSEIRIIYNDYKQQEKGKAAPKAIKKMEPLVFINQYLQHLPPPYFQKTRRYGIHASATKKKYSESIEEKVRKNGQTIRTVMQIITDILKVPVLSCSDCKGQEFEIQLIKPDKTYIQQFLCLPSKTRAP